MDFDDVVISEFMRTTKIFLMLRIRFDFDKEHEDDIHPESHFTFLAKSCHIPVRCGLSLQRFFNFIFKNLLVSPEISEHSAIATGPNSDCCAKEIHSSWRA